MQFTRPVAVVTGANSGIGFEVCSQLLDVHTNIIICLACRNENRAAMAKIMLLEKHPNAIIDIIIIDTSSIKSVLEAAKALKEKYRHINYLYLNAGIMEAGGVRWDRILSGIFSSRCLYVLTTGEGLLIQNNGKTSDGLMRVFATNVFGHYVLIRELEDCLGFGPNHGEEAASQLIWTSSSNAHPGNFSLEDFQHEKGEEPYSSSKQATDMLSVALNEKFNNRVNVVTDMLSVALNEKFNNRGIYSHSACPGLVMTNLTDGILPWWIWLLLLPFMLLMRIFVPSLTKSPMNGATALVWLSTQKSERLDPGTKYRSLCHFTGKPYIGTEKMQVDFTQSQKLLDTLESLRVELTRDARKKC